MLGPEKLPRVVSEFGRWVGRARAMARQFREQLEEEVQLEQARRAAGARAPETPADPAPPQPGARAAPAAGAASTESAVSPPAEPERPPTYSHAHPTDATGASTVPAGEGEADSARR